MKAKSLIMVTALIVLLTAIFAFTADAAMFKDSEYWQNITGAEASALLKSSKNEKNQTFNFNHSARNDTDIMRLFKKRC